MSNCTVTKIWRSCTNTCASSFVWTSPLAVTTVMGDPDLLSVSNSPELKSFLLNICTEAPESITNRLSSGFVQEGAVLSQAPARECTVSFDSFFWVSKHPLPVPRRLCGRTAPAGSSCSLSSNLGAHGFRSWGSHFWMIPCDGPLFPNFYATHRGLRELDSAIRSQLSIFPQNRVSLRAIMWHTFQLNGLLQWNHWSFCAAILWLFWAAQEPQCVENYTCHPTYIRIQTCDSSTREGARSHTTVLCKFRKE